MSHHASKWSGPFALLLLPLGLVASAIGQDVREDYARADRLRERSQGKVFRDRVTPHWFANNDRLWYRLDLPAGAREFVAVDATQGERKPAFDHARLAAALSKVAHQEYATDRLPFDFVQIEDDGKVRFEAVGKGWAYDPAADVVA